MDYPLELLGPERFQLMCQALLAGEHSNIQCMPIGQPDGGRDALQHRSGKFAVFQIKFTRDPSTIKDPYKYLIDKINEEVPKLERLGLEALDQYILITNLPGTAHLGTGLIDRISDFLVHAIPCRSICLWRDDICRRLDRNWDLKWTFPELLRGPDLIRLVHETHSLEDGTRRSKALSAFLRHQYEEDRLVKFKQIDFRNDLIDIFVDMPFFLSLKGSPDEISSVLATIYENKLEVGRSDRLVTISSREGGVSDETDSAEVGIAEFLTGSFSDQRLRFVVVEGAPGQGKSTLGQYICQLHRVRILHEASDIENFPERLRLSRLRLPIRLDLRDLASWVVGLDPFAAASPTAAAPVTPSVETFIARLISVRSGGVDFSVADVLSIAQTWPIIVILDGLDEIAEVEVRRDVVKAISATFSRLSQNSPTLQFVVTTRPAAFTNSPAFDRQQFPHIQISPLTHRCIQNFATVWCKAKDLDPRETVDVKRILSNRIRQVHVAELARNPMQLTILLNLIETNGEAFPDKRTSLYDQHVDIFFKREASKSAVVRDHGVLLRQIHKYVGWELHKLAETKGTPGRLPALKLQELVRQYLEREGRDPAWAERIFGSMVERVYMIVSRLEGTYEFEVQPLREYFAARYLYDTAPYSPPGVKKVGTKSEIFEVTVRNFYWNNVTRFYAGCFSEGELLDLADRIVDLIRDPIFGPSNNPSLLAVSLLGDWVFEQRPKAIELITKTLVSDGPFRQLMAKLISTFDFMPRVPLAQGGQQMVERAWQVGLSAEARMDEMYAAARFLNLNLPDRTILSKWLEFLGDGKAKNLRHLVNFGVHLGVMESIRWDMLPPNVRTDLGNVLVIEFARAGRFDIVQQLKSDDRILYDILSTRPTAYAIRADQKTWGLLPDFIELMELSRFNRYHLPSFWERVRAYEGKADEIESGKEPISDFEGKCKKFTEYLVSMARDKTFSVEKRDVVAWKLLEAAREIFGEWNMWFKAALSLRKPSRKQARHCDIWDGSVDLKTRIGYALTKSTDGAWWADQLERSPTEGDVCKILLFAARCSALGTFGNLLARSAHKIDRLSDEMYGTVLENLFEDYIYRSYTSPDKSVESKIIEQLSGRAVPIILIVGGEKIRRLLLHSHTLSLPYLGHEAEEIRQQSIAESMFNDELDWTTGLAALRLTYSRGACWGGVRKSRSEKSAKIPLSASSQVFADLKAYPLWLIGMCTQAKLAEAQKAVVRVADAARNWTI